MLDTNDVEAKPLLVSCRYNKICGIMELRKTVDYCYILYDVVAQFRRCFNMSRALMPEEISFSLIDTRWDVLV